VFDRAIANKIITITENGEKRKCILIFKKEMYFDIQKGITFVPGYDRIKKKYHIVANFY